MPPEGLDPEPGSGSPFPSGGASVWQRGERRAPELNFATLGLQAKGPGHKLHPMRLIDLLAIHPDRVVGTADEDFHMIPFTAGPLGVRQFRDPADIARHRVIHYFKIPRLSAGHLHALQSQHIARVAMHELDLGAARQRLGGPLMRVRMPLLPGVPVPSDIPARTGNS